ncbi:hypothetical protein ANACOL_00376 [Anaerotruncus colihominis DSM 17241]|uniref:Uncharacterized protein n=1 Tax=Anaerotruncus colihominis DSM 17241 TaxID=445972 RepID=B0P6J8_9FIRM|nr:hypothetical protein ANACOL_00376 [Anaerotruncus colihominis DSM 17241]
MSQGGFSKPGRLWYGISAPPLYSLNVKQKRFMLSLGLLCYLNYKKTLRHSNDTEGEPYG